MIWVIFALLTGAAVLAVLAPLAFRGASQEAADADIAFFEEQIAEIEREREEGRLTPADADAAKTEAARRLLRAEALPKAAAAPARARGPAMMAAVAALVAIPAIALPLYFHIGNAAMPDMPLQARLDARPDPGDLSGAVARIEQHLRDHPDDGRGFEVVAPFYLRTGRGEEAINAYAQALRLLGATAERYAALGEARLVVAKGVVTPEAKKDFEAALALDAQSPMAQYYLALAAGQAGEIDKAVALLEKMLATAPAGAPYIDMVKGEIAKLRGDASPAPADAPTGPAEAPAAEGPQSEQGKAIAAMPADERQQMIRSMVARLAARLAANGEDVDGWLKLIRAYSVLSEAEKAKEAVANARKALAAKADAVARIDALAKELNIGG